MLIVLSDEEAYQIMNDNFDKMKEFDVIDMASDNERYAAFVFKVHKNERCFEVVKLNPETLDRFLSQDWDAAWLAKNIKMIILPNDHTQKRPMWNEIPR